MQCCMRACAISRGHATIRMSHNSWSAPELLKDDLLCCYVELTVLRHTPLRLLAQLTEIDHETSKVARRCNIKSNCDLTVVNMKCSGLVMSSSLISTQLCFAVARVGMPTLIATTSVTISKVVQYAAPTNEVHCRLTTHVHCCAFCAPCSRLRYTLYPNAIAPASGPRWGGICCSRCWCRCPHHIRISRLAGTFN